MPNAIKTLLAILFLLCLVDMPYSYYQFVRFVGFVGFAFLAYEAKGKGVQREMLVYGVFALLFQPFFKIALGSTLWKVVDVVLALGLFSSMLAKRQGPQP